MSARCQGPGVASRKGLRAVGCLAALAAVVSCSAPAQTVLPPKPPTFDVTMREMSFDHPPTAAPGRAVFRVHNAGAQPHRLILVPLPEDFPPIAEQLAGSERRTVNPQAGIPNQLPGVHTSFAVDLFPGRYALVCLVTDPDGQNHAEQGMASEFRVLER